jgi:hypothetical protein
VLSAEDTDFLEVLTHKLRILSANQIARGWWPGRPLASVRRHLLRLIDGGFLRVVNAAVEQELPLDGPLCTWNPGDPPPHFGALAHVARKRANRPRSTAELYGATPRAARLLGGLPGNIKLGSLNHDLNLGALYLKLRDRLPAYAADWVGEDLLVPEKGGDVCADVELRDAAGTTYRVLEFAGSSYKAERFERIHDDCAFRALPLEVW